MRNGLLEAGHRSVVADLVTVSQQIVSTWPVIFHRRPADLFEDAF